MLVSHVVSLHTESSTQISPGLQKAGYLCNFYYIVTGSHGLNQAKQPFIQCLCGEYPVTVVFNLWVFQNVKHFISSCE